MDDLDRKILSLLAKNARMPVKEIAEQVALTSPAVSSRIHRLEQEGIIGCVINDPLAVAYFADPSLCDGFDAYTSVVTEGLSFGQTLVDDHEIWKKPHNSHILTKTDPYRFFLMFFCKVLGANPAQAESILPQILSGEVTV